jgi:hypothetical protein
VADRAGTARRGGKQEHTAKCGGGQDSRQTESRR